jgi:hypothetical protein
MPVRHRPATPMSAVWFKLALTALVFAAFGGAALFGRLTAPEQPPPAKQVRDAATPDFADTPDGARAAAAWYVQRLYSARGDNPEDVRTSFQRLASRPEALDRIVALTTTDNAGTPVPAGSTTRAAVLGIKQETYEPAAARIAVWSVLVTGIPSANAAPTQRWQVDIVSITWQNHAWRFVTTDVLDGPQPPPDPRQPANPVGAATALTGPAGATYQAVPDAH